MGGPSQNRDGQPFDEAEVRSIASRLEDLEGPLLPILHAVLERYGAIDERAVPVIADVLNLSRAEVHGVVSFYGDFRRLPPGRHVLRLCRAEACQSMGADRVAREVGDALGLPEGGTTADGRVTFEPVYCLGNCALSPAALVDGRLHGRVDAARLLALVGG